jgi:hypothetical protein
MWDVRCVGGTAGASEGRNECGEGGYGLLLTEERFAVEFETRGNPRSEGLFRPSAPRRRPAGECGAPGLLVFFFPPQCRPLLQIEKSRKDCLQLDLRWFILLRDTMTLIFATKPCRFNAEIEESIAARIVDSTRCL